MSPTHPSIFRENHLRQLAWNQCPPEKYLWEPSNKSQNYGLESKLQKSRLLFLNELEKHIRYMTSQKPTAVDQHLSVTELTWTQRTPPLSTHISFPDRSSGGACEGRDVSTEIGYLTTVHAASSQKLRCYLEEPPSFCAFLQKWSYLNSSKRMDACISKYSIFKDSKDSKVFLLGWSFIFA